ncbi:MAG: hypothetical protein C4288_17620 [Leptolyngbya sp. ERB_1_1]
MVRYYVAPQHPETLLEAKDKDDRDARYKAALKLAELINAGHLSAKIPNGFSTKRLIEIKREDLMAEHEEEIIHAVKVLSKLSYAKQRVQELHEQAQDARRSIDILFTDKKLTVEEFKEIRRNLKILESFACANSSYKEAIPEAETARSTLNKA